MDDFQRMKETVKPNFTFYRGVVEDNNDPQLLNRCKVRILGIHTEDKKKLPTEFLPWAEMIFTTQRNDQGIPLPGTWVWVFLDKEDENRPIIFGTIPVVNSDKPNTEKGFTDPAGVYPKEDDYKKLSTHRFSRVQELDKTPHKIINDTLVDVSVSGGTGGVNVSFNFKEKMSKNDKSKYPNVAVQETAAGHIFEIDDTPANNRIRVLHSTHTYYEIENLGTMTLKTIKNFERFIEGDGYENIKGNNLRHVVGNEKVGVDGNQDTLVKGNHNLAVLGNRNEGVGGNVTIKVAGKQNETISGGLNINAGPQAKIHASSVFIDSNVYLG